MYTKAHFWHANRHARSVVCENVFTCERSAGAIRHSACIVISASFPPHSNNNFTPAHPVRQALTCRWRECAWNIIGGGFLMRKGDINERHINPRLWKCAHEMVSISRGLLVQRNSLRYFE
jgi:hypothetical protein